MDDCIGSLGNANWFTILDCNSGYWQIPIAENERDKTAFTSHAGVYDYKRMPFGLVNAPVTFQRMLDILLSKYRCKSCLVYLDDIIVFLKNFNNHLSDVQDVLRVIDQGSLSLKLRNATFSRKRWSISGISSDREPWRLIKLA